MRHPSLLAVAMAFAILAHAPSVRADDPPGLDRPGQLYREAIKLFDAEKYPEAEAKLQEVWTLRPSHDVAVSLAQTEQKLNRHAEAAEHLEYALQTMLASKSAAYQTQLRDMLAESRKHCGRIELTTTAGATVTIDGASRGTANPQGQLVVYLEPGHHVLLARLGDREATTPMDASAGDERKVTLALPPAVVPVPVPGTPAAERSVVPTVVLGSLAGVALAGGIGFTAASFGKASAAKDLASSIEERHGFCSPSSPGFDADCAELQDLDSSRVLFRGLAVGSFVISGAALIATLTYAAWPSADPPPVAVLPVVSPEVQGLGIMGAF